MHTGYCDGGSRGNPGPSAYAAILKDSAGRTIDKVAAYFGESTNNVAEYQGLHALLLIAMDNNVRDLHVYSDSMLMVRQIEKKWKIKSPKLLPLWEECQGLIAGLFDSFKITHTYRCNNKEADALVNEVLDSHSK